jgi:osmotically-inducible protein OsmY
VHVREGVVYLLGAAADADDAESAENVASLVPGVESVEDQTRVDPEAVERAGIPLPPSEEGL